MSIVQQVRKTLKRKREGAVISASSLEAIGSRAAIDQTLSRLHRNGEILKIARGMYVVPVKGKFGAYPPAPDKVVRAYAKAKGKRIVPNGALAANHLGLTTQQPVRQVYLTSGQSGRLVLGSNPVEVRHVPEWQTLFSGQPAGEAVRAMAYLGKEKAKHAAVRIKHAIEPSEWSKLRRNKSKFPRWVAEAIEEAERVA